MVELLGVEFGRAAFTEIRVGGARDRLALLRALHDHVALELRERQQHVAQQRVDRVVRQDAEVQYVDGDALVYHLGDEAGRLRHRPREAVELCHDEHIAFSQLRAQPVELRALDLRAGEGVRVDFFRARRRQRRLLRLQTVAVARLRFGRGLYVQSNAWEDDFYLLQQKYGRGIYSHDTALYLLGYSDRTPARYTMTFPKGYNAPSLKQEDLIVKRVIPENYNFGIIKIQSPSGNPICVYDLERTLCDILRGSGSDIQIVGAAMKRYAASKDKDIHKLMQYAEQLRVKPKVLRYMEILL